jgi:hypothetical protein
LGYYEDVCKGREWGGVEESELRGDAAQEVSVDYAMLAEEHSAPQSCVTRDAYWRVCASQMRCFDSTDSSTELPKSAEYDPVLPASHLHGLVSLTGVFYSQSSFNGLTNTPALPK